MHRHEDVGNPRRHSQSTENSLRGERGESTESTSTKKSFQDSTIHNAVEVDCGVSEKRFLWRRDLTTEELQSPESVQLLYAQAVDGGLLDCDSEKTRLAFFGFAAYCCRVGRKPPALFNWGLRLPDKFGQDWWQKLDAADEEWARRAIASLRRSSDVSCGVAATLADSFGEEDGDE